MAFNFNKFYQYVVRGGKPTICGQILTANQLVDLNVELTIQVVKALKAGDIKEAQYTSEYQLHLNTRRVERFLAYKKPDTITETIDLQLPVNKFIHEPAKFILDRDGYLEEFPRDESK